MTSCFIEKSSIYSIEWRTFFKVISDKGLNYMLASIIVQTACLLRRQTTEIRKSLLVQF